MDTRTAMTYEVREHDEGVFYVENNDERIGPYPKDEAIQECLDQNRMFAASEVTDALRFLYEMCDGDEATVGEVLYECDKVARRSWNG